VRYETSQAWQADFPGESAHRPAVSPGGLFIAFETSESGIGYETVRHLRIFSEQGTLVYVDHDEDAWGCDFVSDRWLIQGAVLYRNPNYAGLGASGVVHLLHLSGA
jgi:hypothetical protein